MNKISVLLCSVIFVAPMTFAKTPASHSKSAQIEHGKYLVDHVAMCGDCHSPRDRNGQLIASRYLQGTRLEFKPIHPFPGFASIAPPIAGLPGWTQQEAVRLLTTGVAKNGKQLAPPMPQFRMSRSDAEAVVAYLKSLDGGQK